MKKMMLLLSVIAVAAGGCATQVIRKDPSEVVDFSGRWNDTDARLTAEEMISQCLSEAWIGQFNMAKGRAPYVIVGQVVNRSHEHIDTGIITDSLSRALLNSGKVKFVASKDERLDVREERQDQQVNSAAPTRAEVRQETGADFMLIGSVASIKDETRGKYAILFQVNLELVDMTTNEKVWIGQKPIKKVVKNPAYSL